MPKNGKLKPENQNGAHSVDQSPVFQFLCTLEGGASLFWWLRAIVEGDCKVNGLT